MTPRQIDPGHPKKRHVLRVVGPVVLALGVILTAISVLTVIMGDPFEHPGRAALAFAGMPLMFVGTVLSMLGFGGALARYQAGNTPRLPRTRSITWPRAPRTACGRSRRRWARDCAAGSIRIN